MSGTWRGLGGGRQRAHTPPPAPSPVCLPSFPYCDDELKRFKLQLITPTAPHPPPTHSLSVMMS